RPDTTAASAPKLDLRLNGAKGRKTLALGTEHGRAALWSEIEACDVLITSARARALSGFGLTPEKTFADRPDLVWIAVTGHGWDSARVAFGDDAAASGGLAAFENGAPRFIGDAVADPLTGLAAAARGLRAVARGEGAFVGAALAQVAAYVAKVPA